MRCFKTIERQHPESGDWSVIEFEALKCGDVFRIVEGQTKGENPGPWICISDAVAIPGEPENFGVNCYPRYVSSPA